MSQPNEVAIVILCGTTAGSYRHRPLIWSFLKQSSELVVSKMTICKGVLNSNVLFYKKLKMEVDMRDQILEILTEQRPDVDFNRETSLVTNGILESFDIVSIVAELDDTFDIEISPKELVAENFDSLDAIEAMVERLSEEE